MNDEAPQSFSIEYQQDRSALERRVRWRQGMQLLPMQLLIAFGSLFAIEFIAESHWLIYGIVILNLAWIGWVRYLIPNSYARRYALRFPSGEIQVVFDEWGIHWRSEQLDQSCAWATVERLFHKDNEWLVRYMDGTGYGYLAIDASGLSPAGWRFVGQRAKVQGGRFGKWR